MSVLNLRTLCNVELFTLREACIALDLLDSNIEQDNCFTEDINFAYGDILGCIFITVILFAKVEDIQGT
jgi:hypothetical protein